MKTQRWYVFLHLGLNTKVKLPYPGVGDDSRVLLVDPCNPSQSEEHLTPMQLTSESQALVVEEALERQIYDGKETKRPLSFASLSLALVF